MFGMKFSFTFFFFFGFVIIFDLHWSQFEACITADFAAGWYASNTSEYVGSICQASMGFYFALT